MTATEYQELDTIEKLKLLRACDGKHESLDKLFTCNTCSTLFNIMTEEK